MTFAEVAAFRFPFGKFLGLYVPGYRQDFSCPASKKGVK